MHLYGKLIINVNSYCIVSYASMDEWGDIDI